MMTRPRASHTPGPPVLYAVGLAANIYLLWTIIKDRPETQIVVARWKLRFAAAKAKLENCEGCAKRKAMVNQVVYEAMSIVGHGEGAGR